MKSEKVKEIKKVLEMFAIDNKEMTLFQSPVPQGESCVKSIKYADILTLINELEETNERLLEGSYQKEQDFRKAEKRIAELEKENTELKKYKLDWLNSEKMHLQAEMEETEFELYCTNKAFKKIREENQQLKDRIAELEKGNKDYYDRLNNLQTYIDNHEAIWKANTKMQLKQFAERLKEVLEEYRLENEYFTEHEPNGNLWQLNSSVFCIEVTQDGGLVDETLKDFIE